MKLNHKNTWTFNYRGITAEIVHWGINEYNLKGIWNLYLYILPENIADKELRKNILPKLKPVNWGGKGNKIYDIYSFPLNLDFHGGVTFLNIETYNGKKILKIGCDYNHLYDDYTDWNELVLMNHAKNSIDSLHNSTKILIRCRGNGNYYPESECKYFDLENKDSFYSLEYIDKKQLK